MGVVGILDRKIMQLELPLHAGQYRHVRFVQADPDHVAGLAAPARGVIDGDVGDTPAIDVDASCDHAAGGVRHGRSNGCGCCAHGFRPSMIAVESRFEAIFSGKASTGNSAVNAIEVPAALSPCTTGAQSTRQWAKCDR